MNKANDYFRRRLCGLFLLTDYRREDLARHLRVPLKTVREWEGGEKIPDVYQFREIAAFFELPYEWFLDGAIGTPDTSELAERLGLSEGTVDALEDLADTATPDVLDVLDDAIFGLLIALGYGTRRCRT